MSHSQSFSADLSHPCAMRGATEKNTSPVSAFLRAIAMSENRYDRKRKADENDGSEGLAQNVLSMLGPLDEWMSLPDETQGSLILRQSLLVTSPGLIKAKEDDDDETPYSGQAVKDLLGGIGRDNLPGHETAELQAFDIYTTSARTTRAVCGTSHNTSVQLSPREPVPDVHTILRCFVHERVVRDLKSRSEPLSFIRDIVKNKIIGGALTREKQQYQKLVSRDVLELRIDEKIRVLYAKSKNAVLIIEIVWNHKLDKPIRRAQQEMSVMQNWMIGSGYADEEPFVMIDWVSGRLRPLYFIDVSYDSNSGEANEGDKVFNPSMLDLVLSPQQKRACDFALAANSQCNEFDSDDVEKMAECESGQMCTKISRPVLNILIFQGSAGNGKTTCLLRSGLNQAKLEEKVIFAAATQILADSIEQDLKGNMSKDFRIVIKDKFTEMIRNIFDVGSSYVMGACTEASLIEVTQWLEESDAKKGKKMDKGAMRALADWLMKGHRRTVDTASYTDSVIAYDIWKKEMKKRDEGDMWQYVLEMLIAENEAEADPEGERGSETLSRSSHNDSDMLTSKRLLDNIDRECDMLVIDEAQLYPAETSFQALLLWYRPRKTLLLGMDTKQAVYLGCSNRRALIKAVADAGWARRRVQIYSLTTNFRLPARLVALSNAMVSVLKDTFPKVFDEYNRDDGFESRTASLSSSADTLASAEATDAPVRAIERFPAMLVSGAAATKLREEICHRMDVNRRSVLSMRFAHIKSESAPANYTGHTGHKGSGCSLSDLPTIKFQAVSGLEVSLPVIVDSLLTTYIEELCPRKIFASVGRGNIPEDHEMNMLRTALCTVYTVLTRCRGPLIWLEDKLNPNLEKSHPLVRVLNKKLKQSAMDIDFVTDPKIVDKKFVDRLFNLTDIDEVNAAYEESTRQILQRFKNSFWTAADMLQLMVSSSVAPGMSRFDVSFRFLTTDAYTALMADKMTLIAQLSMSAHEGTLTCCNFLDKICDTLLTKAGCGDGIWALGWGQELRDLLEAVEMFPATTRKCLQLTTRPIIPTPVLMTGTAVDSHALTMELQLSRDVMRLCTCGAGPRPSDLTFLLAFTGADFGFKYEAAAVTNLSTTPSHGSVWVIHNVSGKRKRREGNKDLKGDEMYCACITENCYVLSSFTVEPAVYDDADTPYPRMNAVIYKYEDSSELTITRANDGWMTLQERTFLGAPNSGEGAGGLVQSTSANMGMKIRCSAKGVQLPGAARNHCFGPCVSESNGIIANTLSNHSHMAIDDVSTDTGMDITSFESILMPPVQCERMISLLESLFAGKELDLSSTSSSSKNGKDSIGWEEPVLAGSLSTMATNEDALLHPGRHRKAAEFAWNNLMGGKLMFLGLEARLQPWAMLVPAVLAAMRGGDDWYAPGKGNGGRTDNAQQIAGAYTLLDQVRRSVEACLIRDRYQDQEAMLGAKRRKLCDQADH